MKRNILFLICLTGFLAGINAMGQKSKENKASQSVEQTTVTAASATREVKNLDGTILTLPAEVERVAVPFGPAYEKVFMLGAEDKIVAAGDFHKTGWPWSNVIYKRLDKVYGIPGAHSEFNLEELMKYDPQVAFIFPNTKGVEKMKELGLVGVPPVFSNKFENLKDTVLLYGRILGKKEEAVAEDYAKYFDEKVAMIQKRTSSLADNDRPTVYFANQKILWTSGNGSDIPEVIRLAGGTCSEASVAGGSKTPIVIEDLIQWNPQYIFVDHAGSSGNKPAEAVIADLITDSRLKDLDAVKNNQVRICPTGVFFWDSGVQKILLAEWMAKIIHPALFSDTDMKSELKSFYSRFFRYDLTDEQAEKILLHQNP